MTVGNDIATIVVTLTYFDKLKVLVVSNSLLLPLLGARELVWATSWGVSTRLIGKFVRL